MIDRLLNSEHTVSPSELKIVLRSLCKKATTVAGDTGHITASELSSIVCDVVLEMKEIKEQASCMALKAALQGIPSPRTARR